MLSTDNAGQADLLSSIVTVTDLLSLDNHEPENEVDTLGKLTEAIARLKGVLVNHKNAAASFAESGGLECLLKVFEKATISENDCRKEPEVENAEVVDAPDADGESAQDDKSQLRKELLQLASAALSHVLASCPSAKTFFSKIEGYKELETIIRSSGNLSHISRRDYIFGNLVATAINDFTHCHIYSSMRWHLSSDDLSPKERMDRIAFKVQAAFESVEQLPNPECIPIIINLLPEILSDQDLGLAVCDTLQVIVNASRANQLSIYSSSALSHVVDKVILQSSTWAAESLSPDQTDILEDLIFSLSPLGLPLSLAASIVSTAVQRIGSTSEASLLPVLQEFAIQSRLPPHFHFDMHPHGYSALTFPSMTLPFPPLSAAGYTISMWFRIENFDPNMHITLFGAFDTSQKCFCMVYIEQDTHKLVLQTSLRSSVRFKTFEFTQGRWYHVGISHKRPRTTTSARALLHVDGALVEQVKCSYPASPPTAQSPVSAFFGTPPTFANSTQKPVLQWSLSQAHIWGDLLPEDLIEIIFQLGPRYHGNLQDSLGQFQTYDASTALNIRLGEMGGPKAEKSVLMAAVRGKGATWASESKLLLSASPLAAAVKLNAGTLAILNSGVPRITEALTVENGFGTTIGDPIIVIPQCLDDTMWCLGGCAVGLRMVDKASTAVELLLATKVLFESIRLSWRNSEDMERCHGYEILAFLFKGKKREFINMELLQVVSEFIGVDFEDARESTVTNPLAFRYLCLDFAIWKRGNVETQISHLQMLLSLIEQSRHRPFNLRRLNKMHMVKKMLFALRSGMFPREVLPSFISTMRAIVRANFSTDVVRALATFVTRGKSGKQALSKGSKSPTKRTFVFEDEIDIQKLSRKTSGAKDATAYEVVVLEMLVDVLLSPERRYINKFATTITSKWPLLLMSSSNPDHVMHGVKVLARLLVTQGPGYVLKFASRAQGFPILRKYLCPWWEITPIWPTLLAVLFGVDVVSLKSLPAGQALRLFDLVQLVKLGDDNPNVVFPEIFSIISALLKIGFDATLRSANNHIIEDTEMTISPVSLTKEQNESSGENTLQRDAAKSASLLQVVVQFLLDMHSTSSSFREFASSPQVIENLLGILFPIICSADPVHAETELMSKDSILTFDTGEIRIESLTAHYVSTPVLRPASSLSFRSVEDDDGKDSPDQPSRPRASSLRRASSYVLVASDAEAHNGSKLSINPVGSKAGHKQPPSLKAGNSTVGSLLELVTAISVDNVLGKREFTNFDFGTKLPPGFQEYHIYFVTYLLRNTLSHLDNALSLDRTVLYQSSRTLMNVIKFSQRLADAVLEGWFLNGAAPLWEFVGKTLEFLDTPDIAKQKLIKSSEPNIASLRKVFNRLLLSQLSEIEYTNATEDVIIALLDRILFWQTVLFSPANQDSEFIRMFCYHLYVFLFDTKRRVRLVASNIWRLLQLNKGDQVTSVLNLSKTPEHQQVSSGFLGIIETDADTFLLWLDAHRPLMDDFFQENLAPAWENFVAAEGRASEEAAKVRMSKRKEKLKLLISQDATVAQALTRNEIILTQWQANIYDIEHVRFLKTVQDTADHAIFVETTWNKLLRQITRERAILDPNTERKWRLDMTEGRSRMRKKMMPDIRVQSEEYQPKGSIIAPPVRKVPETGATGVTTPIEIGADDSEAEQQSGAEELDFEIVDPDETSAIEEDKNRKVLRSLEHGDTVMDVFNVSRIIGLDAHEGLLILGKSNIYLIDHYFQRSDQEIVDVWDAPKEERDPFIQILAGQDASTRPTMLSTKDLHESRHWPNDQLISASQRRFLFRDVALELFFSDGRSCLITMSSADRNRAYSKLVTRITVKVPNSIFQGLDGSEEVKFAGAVALTSQLGSRLANVLSATHSIPATKSWEKGLISNFHYLMILNSLAGRSYNDLTQYPVAPWVLADYTSNELDLTNPATFRDLSKPMGAQVPERQAEFDERYRSFEEIEDRSQPPFHYGTHYSSSMIVCSYLIRLRPLVESYLLLQGGQFDHAERLFHSIGKAWNSASRDNMTDVRELIPEFFYLDSFLTNHNSFNFGVKQDDNEVIDSVVLPPWAKGDPKVFIQRHREALECDYVSEHLHEWIDLIFGYKQRGEAAIKATNVFHHLSYQGSIDLEKISDPVERLASINIIHNFGQTPKQLFTKPHPKRRVDLQAIHFEDFIAELQQPLTPLQVHTEPVTTLFITPDRFLAGFGQKAFIPGKGEYYLEWGFSDGSVRIFMVEGDRFFGLAENLHSMPITCAVFADENILLTGSEDTTVCVWQTRFGKNFEIQLKECLRGHSDRITSLAFSKSFSIIVSGSEDGRAIVWDLNRLKYVRQLQGHVSTVELVAINDATGDIATCSGPNLHWWTLNGDPFAEQMICTEARKGIIACVFYEGVGHEWISKDLLFTAHKEGVVRIWSRYVRKRIKAGESPWQLNLVHELHHEIGFGKVGKVGDVTSLLVSGPQKTLYTGTSQGYVWNWTLPDNLAKQMHAQFGTSPSTSATSSSPNTTMPEGQHRLYVRGKHISYTRGKRNSSPNVSLIKIEGCDSTKDAEFYLGKRIAYVYRAQRAVRGSKIRVIWGKVMRTHGNSGIVRAKFRNNLPPKSLGANVRVMLYPSNI